MKIVTFLQNTCVCVIVTQSGHRGGHDWATNTKQLIENCSAIKILKNSIYIRTILNRYLQSKREQNEDYIYKKVKG